MCKVWQESFGTGFKQVGEGEEGSEVSMYKQIGNCMSCLQMNWHLLFLPVNEK